MGLDIQLVDYYEDTLSKEDFFVIDPCMGNLVNHFLVSLGE